MSIITFIKQRLDAKYSVDSLESKVGLGLELQFDDAIIRINNSLVRKYLNGTSNIDDLLNVEAELVLITFQITRTPSVALSINCCTMILPNVVLTNNLYSKALHINSNASMIYCKAEIFIFTDINILIDLINANIVLPNVEKIILININFRFIDGYISLLHGNNNKTELKIFPNLYIIETRTVIFNRTSSANVTIITDNEYIVDLNDFKYDKIIHDVYPITTYASNHNGFENSIASITRHKPLIKNAYN